MPGPAQQPRQMPMIQPQGPAFNPDRLGQFSHLVASGMNNQSDTWGSLIGNLAKTISGSYGTRLERGREKVEGERRGRMEAEDADRRRGEFARAAGVDPGVAGSMMEHPALLQDHLSRRREGPSADPGTQPRAPVVLYNQEGESRSVGNWAEATEAHGEGFTQTAAPDTTPADRRIVKGADKYQYYSDTGERVLPNVQAPAVEEDGPAFKQETTMRKEFDALTADARSQSSAAARVFSSAQDPSAAGDLAMIFNYMKVLDPGSVVRESEFATAANAAGVPERVRGMWNRAREGTRLSVVQRNDFVDRTQKLMVGVQDLYGQAQERYAGLATSYGFDPQRIAGDLASFDPAAGDAPQTKSTGFSGLASDVGGALNDIVGRVPEAARSTLPDEQIDELLRQYGLK